MCGMDFKAKVDSLLACFVTCVKWIHLTSDVTPVDLMAASMAAKPFTHILVHVQILARLKPMTKCATQ